MSPASITPPVCAQLAPGRSAPLAARPSGMMAPAAPSIAQRACRISFERYDATCAGSCPRPRGSQP